MSMKITLFLDAVSACVNSMRMSLNFVYFAVRTSQDCFKWSKECIFKVCKRKITLIKALRFIHQWRTHGRVTFANRKIHTIFNIKQLHPFVINCCDVGKVTRKLRFCFSVATWGNFIIEQMAATHWFKESTVYDTTHIEVHVRDKIARNFRLST